MLPNSRSAARRSIAEACDIADRVAVEKLFENIRATMPPVAGVLHAAMVLDDGLLSDLDEERFRRVLAPKVQGAENLDAITYGMNARLLRAVFVRCHAAGQSRPSKLRRRKRVHGGRGPSAAPGGPRCARRRVGADHRCRRDGAFRDAAVAVPEIDGGSRHARRGRIRPHGASARVAIRTGARSHHHIADRRHLYRGSLARFSKSPTYANLVRGDQAIGETAAGHLDLHVDRQDSRHRSRAARTYRRHCHAVGAGPACAGGGNQPGSAGWRNRPRLTNGP